MLYAAKNAIVPVGDSHMEYIRFGSGPQVLIMLPGLGDGLRTMKGTAFPMALLYRKFAKDFTVYAFSRRSVLQEGCTTRDMADDLAHAMEVLGISQAHVLGVSMGGMIAQQLAAAYPEKVRRLILAVTCPCTNPIMDAAIAQWTDLARSGDHTALMESNMRLIYSDAYYRKNRWTLPLVGKLTKPRSYDRFLKQAQACLTHNALELLPGITAPTLVIGGGQDRCLGAEASCQLAEAIPGARLKIYEDWGHGLYEEAADFNDLVASFLKES